MVNSGKILLYLIIIIGSLITGELHGRIIQADKDNVISYKNQLTIDKTIIQNLQDNNEFSKTTIIMNEIKAKDLIVKNNNLEMRIKNANKIIAKNKKSINLHTILGPEFMCILEAASTGNTTMSQLAGNACPNWNTNGIIPSSTSILYWISGLIAHDQECTNLANARLEWYSTLRNNYNITIQGYK